MTNLFATAQQVERTHAQAHQRKAQQALFNRRGTVAYSSLAQCNAMRYIGQVIDSFLCKETRKIYNGVFSIMNTINPPTPGGILEREFLDPLNMTRGALATRIGVSRTAVGEIIKGERAISTDMAFRLARCFGNTPRFWLNLQQQYDIRMAERDGTLKAKLNAIEPILA